MLLRLFPSPCCFIIDACSRRPCIC
jgi:hypothetical protein